MMSTFDPQTRLMMVGVAICGAVMAVVNTSVVIWHHLNGIPVATYNPFAMLFNALGGKYTTSPGGWELSTIIAATTLVVGVLVVAGVVTYVLRWGSRRKRGDAAASKTGRGGEIASITTGAVKEKAKKLGVVNTFIGLPIGVTVKAARKLWSSVEDVCILLAGPRTGKTTAWVVPRILAAFGAVVTTSNKRDVVDITRDKRELTTGERVWVFDPQGIAQEEQTWWWNPLTYVEDAISARALAQVFVDSTREAEARTDAFFDGKALDLLTAFLLAARVGGRDLFALHHWVNDLEEDEPVKLLYRAREVAVAETLRGIQQMPHETKGGIYGGAAQTLSFLLNDAAMKWVLPEGGMDEFVPERFVRTRETLYCLSQEGRGSASPIVTALTVAVTEAAVKYATTLPGGRMNRPMTIVLDEAANVCKWRELPDMYSHFGSRGVLVDTVLQSWSQGVSVWGEAGMRKLWSAANVKVYGGGISERGFLSELSDLIGVRWEDSIQDSYSPGGHSRSVTMGSQQRPIADVAELASLPAGRAWVLSSGNRAVLARLVPYWEQGK